MRSRAKFRENLNLQWFTVQGHPGSSTLAPIESAKLCNFLLVISSNFGRILYRFRDIDAQSSFPHPPLFDATAQGEPVRISGFNLHRKNERVRATLR